MLKRSLFLIASLLFLPLLAGCLQMQTIRIVPDSPDDIESLLAQQEFARVRRLTVRHPAIDTTELQARIDSLETAYEKDILLQTRKLEDSNELLSAVELLTEALHRVPHSTRMRVVRTTLETQRVHQLKVNERESLITRAAYLLDRQQLYTQQTSLRSPSHEQRREHAQHESEQILLAGELLEHARYAMQIEDLESAGTCLALALKLDEGADTGALKAELQAMQKTRQESTRQAVNIRNARIKRKTDRDEKNETEKLLATTQQALDANKLRDAREAFTKIPPSTSNDSEVIAVQSTLDQAVSLRVRELIVTGDAQYRAEKIHDALRTWSDALALDPGNPELRERTDRANKVLAKLEELKRQQQK